MRFKFNWSVRRNRRWVVLMAIALVVAIGISMFIFADFGVVNLLGVSTYFGGWRDIPFDKEVWRTADGMVDIGWSCGPVHDNRRTKMINDLFSHHLHKGMAKDEVLSLLGKPEADCDDVVAMYPLLAFPSPDQRALAWFRWRASDPYLVITYKKKGGAMRVESADVTKW